MNNIRILTSTSLFDGHDASINIMRRVLQEQGVEIIHFGAMLGGHIPTDSSTGFVALRMTTR